MLFLALTPAISTPAAAESPPAVQSRSLRDGIYSLEQARRGQRLFERVCGECHAPEDFVGFLEAWEGDSVRSLFETVRLTMPEDSPARLKREEYADVISYLFSLNGLPAGEVEMGSDASSLDDILIETADAEQSREQALGEA